MNPAGSSQRQTLDDSSRNIVDSPPSLAQRLDAIDGLDAEVCNALAAALSGKTLDLGALDAHAVAHLPTAAWTAIDDAAGGVSHVILPPHMSSVPESILCYPQLSCIEARAYEGVDLDLRPQATEHLARRCIALNISRQDLSCNMTVRPGMDDIVSVGPPDEGLLQACTGSNGEPMLRPIPRWVHPDIQGRGFQETSVSEPSSTLTPDEIIGGLYLTSIHKDCLRHALCRRTLDLRMLPPRVVLQLPARLWRAWAVAFSRKTSAANHGLRLRLPAAMTQYPRHANHLDLDVLELHDFRGREIDLTALPPGSLPSNRVHTLTLDLGTCADESDPTPATKPLATVTVLTLAKTHVDLLGDPPRGTAVEVEVWSLLPDGDQSRYSTRSLSPLPANRPPPLETLAALRSFTPQDLPSLDGNGRLYIEMGQAVVLAVAGSDSWEVHSSQLFSCMLISGIGADGRFGVYHYPAMQFHAPETRATLELWLAALKPESLWIQAKDPDGAANEVIERMLRQDLDVMQAWASHHCPNRVMMDLKRRYDGPCSAYVNGEVLVGSSDEVLSRIKRPGLKRAAALQELPSGQYQDSAGRVTLLLGRDMTQPMESDTESDSDFSSDLDD